MKFRNDGRGDSNILQNRFTAYLLSALKRKKREYLTAQSLRQNRELSLEDNESPPSASKSLEDDLPYEFQVEDEALLQALAQLNDRERLILIAHVLDGIDFDILAQDHGLSYKGVSTLYYRLRGKLRKYMGGGRQ